jgi:hypothetical protein
VAAVRVVVAEVAVEVAPETAVPEPAVLALSLVVTAAAVLALFLVVMAGLAALQVLTAGSALSRVLTVGSARSGVVAVPDRADDLLGSRAL